MKWIRTPARVLGDASDQTPAWAFWHFGSLDNWKGTREGQPSLPITSIAWSWPIWRESDAPMIERGGKVKRQEAHIFPNPDLDPSSDRFADVAAIANRQGPAQVPWDRKWRGGEGTSSGPFVLDGLLTEANLKVVQPL